MEKKLFLLALLVFLVYSCQNQEDTLVNDDPEQKANELATALGMEIEEVSEEEMQNGLFIPYEDLVAAIEAQQLSTKTTTVKLYPSPTYFTVSFIWKSPNEIEAQTLNNFTVCMGLPTNIGFKLLLRGDGVNYKWNFDTKVDFTQLTLRSLSSQQNFIGKIARISSSPGQYDVGISVKIDFYTTIAKKPYRIYGTLGLGITIDNINNIAPKSNLPCNFSVGVLF